MIMLDDKFSEVTSAIEELAALCVKNGSIDPELYGKYEVKRGLRDIQLFRGRSNAALADDGHDVLRVLEVHK